jgi:hypothetical protein
MFTSVSSLQILRMSIHCNYFCARPPINHYQFQTFYFTSAAYPTCFNVHLIYVSTEACIIDFNLIIGVNDLHDLYSSRNIIRVIRLKKGIIIGEAWGTFGRDRGCAFGVLLGRPEGKRPLVRPRNKWKDSIKMSVKKWDEEGWTGLFWLKIWTGGG